MEINEECFYVITNYKTIGLDDITSNIKIVDSDENAIKFPDCSIVVAKKRMKPQTAADSSFVYPFVYRYSILDISGDPIFLSYGKNNCSSYILETIRSGYGNDIGGCNIPIFDRNGALKDIYMSANKDWGINLIKNLIEFLIRFEREFSSDWVFYDEKNKLLEQVSILEQEILIVNQKLEETAKEFKDFKAKAKKKKVQL